MMHLPRIQSSRSSTAAFTAAAYALTIASLLAVAGGCQSGAGGAGSGDGSTDARPPAPGDITGRYIAVVTDADLAATALVDGLLSRPKQNESDALTIVRLPIASEPSSGSTLWDTGFAQAAVSSSVTAPPSCVAVSTDGRFAVVAETRGPAPAGAQRIGDLPEGTRVTTIDLSDPMQPRVIAKVEVGRLPTSVAISPDGAVLAVATSKPGGQIVLASINNMAVAAPFAWPLLGMEDDAASATGVAWHPAGNYLAVMVAGKDLVAFYEFRTDASTGDLMLRPWGTPVVVGNFPFHGKFSPCGRYFLTSNLQWNNASTDYLTSAGDGTVSVIKLSTLGAEGKDALHQVVSSAAVGMSPQCITISADGKFVITANLRRSMMPAGQANLLGGSLSLLGFDAETGVLTPLGETEVNAMPEGVTFDADGTHVIVSKFRSLDPRAIDGELDFYKLVRGSTPRLIKGDFSVSVGVGPHGVVIVR